MELSKQAKKARNQYQKAWRKRNKERWQELQVNYWEKKARELEKDTKDKEKNKNEHF